MQDEEFLHNLFISTSIKCSKTRQANDKVKLASILDDLYVVCIIPSLWNNDIAIYFFE